MPLEILALIAKPHLLMAILALGALCGMVAERVASRMSRQRWPRSSRGQWSDKRRSPAFGAERPWPPSRRETPPKRPDAADQLRIVMGAKFRVRALLNKAEARVFKELDRIVIGCNPTWQVMAQVSLGEILWSEDAEAYGCINSKRVDLLLMDDNCRPRHAIEYQGSGHHQGTAAARDAVKKEALRRAGIGYHEVLAGHTTPAELRRLVAKLVDKPTTPV